MKVPVAVRYGVDSSAPLAAHIQRRLDAALRHHAARVRRVGIRVCDVNGPRHGANDKVTHIEVSLRPRGRVVASATADDVYVSVARAAHRVKHALARRLDHRQRHRRSTFTTAVATKGWPSSPDSRP